MFSVQTYDTIDSWQGGQLMANTRDNQVNLRNWLSHHGPRGGTDMLKGINALMAVRGVQERFLLADGTRGRPATAPSSSRKRRPALSTPLALVCGLAALDTCCSATSRTPVGGAKLLWT